MNGFSSGSLAVGDRKAAYEAALRTYFGMDDVEAFIRVDPGEPDQFAASIEPLVLGQVRGAVHMSNAPHSVRLEPTDARCHDLDFYLLLDGEITLNSIAGPVRLKSGDMAMLRARDELSSASSRMEMVVLSIPEHLLHRRLTNGPLAINRAISGRTALGSCLGALLRTAAARRTDLSPEEGLLLQSSVVDAALHVASLEDEAGDRSGPRPDRRLRLLQRSALNLIAHADLSPRHLADDLGMSVRTVHRLFHSSGVTFRDWLRERRLERCWTELADPMAGRRTVADVAFRWGFNDLTTFNRSFRNKYGVPPTAVRAGRPTR